MLRLFILAALVTIGYPWELATSHTNVILKMTPMVTTRCFIDPKKPASGIYINHITRIRLLKLHLNDTWGSFAEILLPNTSQVRLADPSLTGVSVSASLGDPHSSFLSLTWATATEDTVGTYKCEIDGFSVGNDAHVYTNVIKITDTSPQLTDLVDVVMALKKATDRNSRGLQNITDRLGGVEPGEESALMGKVQTMIDDSLPEVRYWPNGNYSLIASKNGCPSTPYSEMTMGYAKVKSRTSSSLDHEFPPDFLDDVYTRSGSDHKLNFRFCRSSRDPQGHISWPKGSYCIHCVQNSNCPDDFNYGYVTSYLKSSSSLTYEEKNIVDTINCGTSSRSVYFNFCCRSDGNADTPITLPNKIPFYLSRYKGKCQAVRNMNVREQTMRLDTDPSKTDKYDNSYNPDSELNDFVLHLCYYTPSV